MPASMQIGRARLQVSSVDRSLEFYCDRLGFTVVERSNGFAAMGGASGDAFLELREVPGASPVPRGGRVGLYHFAVLLPAREDLGRLIGHLHREGLRFGAADHLVSEALYLTDPDGLGIEIYADRPREEWRTVGGQLEMDSRPLPVHEIVAEAGGTRWEGIPAGTGLGHLHFSVDSLDSARTFYQEALGLDLMVWTYPGAVFLSAGGYHHHVGANTWAAGAPAATGNDARLLEWEIIVADRAGVEAVAANLEAHAFPVVRTVSGWRIVDRWGIELHARAAG